MNTTTTNKRVTFSFAYDDPAIRDLRELQYSFSSLNFQEIVKVAISKLKREEFRNLTSAELETAYLLSNPKLMNQILEDINPSDYLSKEEMWATLED